MNKKLLSPLTVAVVETPASLFVEIGHRTKGFFYFQIMTNINKITDEQTNRLNISNSCLNAEFSTPNKPDITWDIMNSRSMYVAEFKQADFLIRMKGNSMYPKYSSGDIIACKKVHELLYFQWNKIYAIYTNSQGIMVKRVRESAKGDEYITLVSDNPNYAPFDVPRSDIAAIALVIGVIRVE